MPSIRVAVAQDAGGNALRFERRQHRLVFGEGAQGAVLVHQSLDIYVKLAASPRILCLGHYSFDSVHQRRAGQRPKRLVVRAVVAGGDEAGVVNLLVAPQQTQGLAVAGEQLLGQQPHAVHVKQGAVGVEQHGAGRARGLVAFGRGGRSNGSGFGHAPTVLDTCSPINCALVQLERSICFFRATSTRVRTTALDSAFSIW
jgi:hypothetical protein